MMNIILVDDYKDWVSLLPLTFAKPIAALRIGILTISEKWIHYFPNSFVSFNTQQYLQRKYPLNLEDDSFFINSAFLPDIDLVKAIQSLLPNQVLVKEDVAIAWRGNNINNNDYQLVIYNSEIQKLNYTWDLFKLNGLELRKDFLLLTQNRKSKPVTDPFTKVYCTENVFIEEGVVIKSAILNAEEGPIYIGKNAHIHEGAIIKGAFALGESSHINMGAKLRGDNTIGPHCKIGGELSNIVIQGYSNKAHDGFLGNSVIGEWCNLGADTNTSNLKNNYSEIALYQYSNQSTQQTGLQFCGLIMGDHSKSGINTMFNTGTVVGFCANIFGAGFPPKFIPSFSWCDGNKLSVYELDKALFTAQKMFERRNIAFSDLDKDIFIQLYNNK
ncbi:MAG: glucose-1-phosphate thymidylyltransferase [Cytophagales bacterium]|nr:MAG: glucose-1-phosphate thymidylyltransferase [Cytophagales bacterium]